MNLHISAPSVFIDSFHKNLVELGIEKKNRIILRSTKTSELFQSAKLYSTQFEKLIGDTSQYEKVFIHQFSPLMYRWVALNKFKQLNWMIWGADLYNLPELEDEFYEPLTRAYVKSHWDVSEILYRVKLVLTSQRFKREAYAKVDHILTWMNEEFSFAKEKLPLPKASHQFFFYENPTPYHELVQQEKREREEVKSFPTFILGNSGAKTNNHLDVLDYFRVRSIQAKLIIPVSYGDSRYVRFLRKNASRYEGSIEFVDKFMSFEDYTKLLQSADGLIMNTIRPQGYGNIFMMLCMGKPVYINPKNISLNDLTSHGIQWNSVHDLVKPIIKPERSSADTVIQMMSHEKLESTYHRLFS